MVKKLEINIDSNIRLCLIVKASHLWDASRIWVKQQYGGAGGARTDVMLSVMNYGRPHRAPTIILTGRYASSSMSGRCAMLSIAACDIVDGRFSTAEVFRTRQRLLHTDVQSIPILYIFDFSESFQESGYSEKLQFYIVLKLSC